MDNSNSPPFESHGEFDVFLSHNSKDKPLVRKLAEALRQRGLSVWVDEEQAIPGRDWQEALNKIIETTRSAAVLVGKDGMGPWQEREMKACLVAFVDRQLPVIPVLLPDAPDEVALPPLLKSFTWVDMRDGIADSALAQLECGITGKRPRSITEPIAAPVTSVSKDALLATWNEGLADLERQEQEAFGPDQHVEIRKQMETIRGKIRELESESGGAVGLLSIILGLLLRRAVLLRCLILILLTTITWWWFRPITVPDLVGHDFEAAKSQLRRLGLEVKDSWQIGDAPENQVLSQNPLAGERLRRGAVVNLRREAPFVEVPEFVDETIEAARKMAERVLKPYFEEVRCDPNRAGRVLKQNRRSGERVRIGTPVELKVEARLLRVPTDLVGMSAMDATQRLDRLRLVPKIELLVKNSSKAGQVLEVPLAGTLLQQGDEVRLIVEHGLIEAPNVLGLTIDAARDVVEASGLQVDVLDAALFVDLEPGTVGRQQPPLGTPMTVDGVIQLTPVGEYVPVPDVRGQLREAAVKKLEQVGLTTGRVSEGFGRAPGTVIGQQPPPNTHVLTGSPVELHVATGRPIIFDPTGELEQHDRRIDDALKRNLPLPHLP